MAVTVNGGAPSAPQISEFQSVFQLAPSSHVSSGGAAHANAVAAGAAGFMTGADKTKLDSVASGATANSTDASLLARANHTGTQTASTISDFNSASRAQTEAELIAGTNVTITPGSSGATRTLTIAAAAGGATNLSYTAATRVIASDTGTDATLPLMSSGDAGLVPASGGGTTNYLRADGTWVAPSGGGSVTSVGMSVPTGLSIAGSPVTGSGTLAVTLTAGYVIPTQAALDAKLNADIATDITTTLSVPEENDEYIVLDVSAADEPKIVTTGGLRTRLSTTPIGTALGTTGSVALDFSALTGTQQSITATGNITFTTANLAAGRSLELRIAAGGSSRTLTWPAWVAFGAALPTTLASGAVLRLTLFANSTTDGSVDAAAAVSV